jgi:hypothetical protein
LPSLLLLLQQQQLRQQWAQHQKLHSLCLVLLLLWQQWPCGRALQALLCHRVLLHQLLGKPQPQQCPEFLGQQGLQMLCVFCGPAVVLQLAGLQLQLIQELCELAGAGPQRLCA